VVSGPVRTGNRHGHRAVRWRH